MMIQQKIDQIIEDLSEIKTSVKVTEVHTKTNNKRLDKCEQRLDELNNDGLPLRTKDWGAIILLLIAFTTLIISIIKGSA